MQQMFGGLAGGKWYEGLTLGLGLAVVVIFLAADGLLPVGAARAGLGLRRPGRDRRRGGHAVASRARH